MYKFKEILSRAVPLPIKNIDTDQIIPARFLKYTSRVLLGQHLFIDLCQRKDFVLNNPKYSGTILVVKQNFGCGSSREHAAWAILDYGFRAIVSSLFADIFKENALNNGLLPVEISETFLSQIFFSIKKNPKTLVKINLPKQIILLENNEKEFFNIKNYKKKCLIEGNDDIDVLVKNKDKIESFEKQHFKWSNAKKSL